MRNSITGCAVEQCAFCGAVLCLTVAFEQAASTLLRSLSTLLRSLATLDKKTCGEQLMTGDFHQVNILVVVVVNAI